MISNIKITVQRYIKLAAISSFQKQKSLGVELQV